jgi:hypothetical protein
MCNLHLQLTIIISCQPCVQACAIWYQNKQLKINWSVFVCNGRNKTSHKAFLCILYTTSWNCCVMGRSSPSTSFISTLSERFRLNLALNYALAFAVQNCFLSRKRLPYAEHKTHLYRFYVTVENIQAYPHKSYDLHMEYFHVFVLKIWVKIKFDYFRELTCHPVHTTPELASITNYLRTFSKLYKHY